MFCRLAGPIPAVLRTQTQNKTQQRIDVEILLLKRSSAMTVYSVKCNIVNIHVHEGHIFFLPYYFRNVKSDLKKMGN